MKLFASKSLRHVRGQGMTEYIIIVALIAIAAIGVITLFGKNIRNLFATSADALAGSTSVSAGTAKSGNSERKVKGLSDFAQDNAGSGS